MTAKLPDPEAQAVQDAQHTVLARPQSVLISGASTGIGRCCAEWMAQQGWQVFAGVRKPSDAQQLAQAHVGITPVHLDVTDASSIREALAQVMQATREHGLDGLVNNAGMVVGGPVELVPLEAWREQWEVNVLGHVALTQQALPCLRRRAGRIVNMGSVAGLAALPFVAPYSMSKYALEAWTDAMRVELSPWNIRVALVEPGSVATPIWEKSMAYVDRLAHTAEADWLTLYGPALDRVRLASQRSARRGIAPEQVARAVAHALTARRPRTRYLVGSDAAWRPLFAALPDAWKDVLIRWKLGLPLGS